MVQLKAERTVLPVTVMAVLFALGGCATDAPLSPAEREVIKEQAALEIDRICALPQPERDAELKKVREETGMMLLCGNESDGEY